MVVEIDNIELSFAEKQILNGIYIRAQLGEVTGILGRNGSGKTSLFKIVFGSLRPKYKSIRIDGKPILKNLFQTNNIAYLPQHQLLPKRMRIRKIFGLFNLDWTEFISDFEGFMDYHNSRVEELSSGELRVLETYIILSLNKKIILLDEPFSFIAPIYIEQFKKMILNLKKDRIVFISDHFYRDILEICDTIYLLKDCHSKLISNKDELVAMGYLSANSQ
nr:ATP-binding cassette domain-containing protein [Allomuricauda sp.]